MRSWTVSFLILGIVAARAQAQTPATFTNTLLPEPAHLSLETGRLELTPSFTVVTDRFHDARLDEVIGRALLRLESQIGLQIATAAERGAAGTLNSWIWGQRASKRCRTWTNTRRLLPGGHRKGSR
jgi:hypothetical protein